MRPSLLVDSLPCQEDLGDNNPQRSFLFLDKAQALLYNFVSADVSANGQRC